MEGRGNHSSLFNSNAVHRPPPPPLRPPPPHHLPPMPNGGNNGFSLAGRPLLRPPPDFGAEPHRENHPHHHHHHHHPHTAVDHPPRVSEFHHHPFPPPPQEWKQPHRPRSHAENYRELVHRIQQPDFRLSSRGTGTMSFGNHPDATLRYQPPPPAFRLRPRDTWSSDPPAPHRPPMHDGWFPRTSGGANNNNNNNSDPPTSSLPPPNTNNHAPPPSRDPPILWKPSNRQDDDDWWTRFRNGTNAGGGGILPHDAAPPLSINAGKNLSLPPRPPRPDPNMNDHGFRHRFDDPVDEAPPFRTRPSGPPVLPNTTKRFLETANGLDVPDDHRKNEGRSPTKKKKRRNPKRKRARAEMTAAQRFGDATDDDDHATAAPGPTDKQPSDDVVVVVDMSSDQALKVEETEKPPEKPPITELDIEKDEDGTTTRPSPLMEEEEKGAAAKGEEPAPTAAATKATKSLSKSLMEAKTRLKLAKLQKTLATKRQALLKAKSKAVVEMLPIHALRPSGRDKLRVLNLQSSTPRQKVVFANFSLTDDPDDPDLSCHSSDMEESVGSIGSSHANDPPLNPDAESLIRFQGEATLLERYHALRQIIQGRTQAMEGTSIDATESAANNKPKVTRAELQKRKQEVARKRAVAHHTNMVSKQQKLLRVQTAEMEKMEESLHELDQQVDITVHETLPGLRRHEKVLEERGVVLQGMLASTLAELVQLRKGLYDRKKQGAEK